MPNGLSLVLPGRASRELGNPRLGHDHTTHLSTNSKNLIAKQYPRLVSRSVGIFNSTHSTNRLSNSL